MWTFAVFVCFTISLAAAQNGRTSAHQDHGGHGWDIRLAVPGDPGNDYPTLGSIPRTSFSCAGKEPGYYADLETNCQVFRVCTVGSTYGFQSFLCPNGTLFNQAVFVCDWWMNVNCPVSEQLFNTNNEKFGNLRLGPQLMKDIKKMLTHPMRNPYDKAAMKSNLIVMQDYKPPFGQLFPNGALIAGPERPPNNIYVPAKQIQAQGQNGFNNNDIAFAASTPDSRYIPAAFNTVQPSPSDAEVYQRQRQNAQYVQSNRIQNTQIQRPGTTLSNGHAPQFTQNTYNANLQSSRPTQSYNNGNLQFGQRQLSNTRPTQAVSTQNTINHQRGQLIQQNSQYTNNQNPARLNGGKQAEFAVSYNKQQYILNQEKQPHTYKQPQYQFSNEVNGKIGNEAKQNLVSAIDEIPSTVISKTLTLKRIIQDPKSRSPKSRITVKTWIVKPSKSGKLLNPTPYTYEKPTQSPNQRLFDTTPYVYDKPTTQSQKIISVSDQPYVYNKPSTPSQKFDTAHEQPYVYNKPTAPTQKLVTELDEPYFYNKPTTAFKQIFSTSREPSRLYPTPTPPRPTLSHLYLSPSSVPPTQSSRLYLPPTTYNPSSRLYLPPSENQPILSRQYLAPSTLQQPTGFQSEQLRAAPTTPSPFFALSNTPTSNNENIDQSTYTHSNQSPENKNNLTFTDILTKEKLDLTVDDIVKDTSSFLKTASPARFEQLRDSNSIDYPEDTYLPPEKKTDSEETVTSQSPISPSQNARLVNSPSLELEPPAESLPSDNENVNQLSNLPFFKESLAPTNTIERTVSLKISIPEKIARYLFKKRNESDFDRLEILNTGSSNYLVLTNNEITKKSGVNFIPIGKLIADKESNISNSQALVFSLLADSINLAKDYNIAQQETIQSTPSQPQFQNVNNDEFAKITNQISQLTSSQYSGNNNGAYKSAKIVSTAQSSTNQGKQSPVLYPSNGNLSQKQIQSIQKSQYKLSPTQINNQAQSNQIRYQSGTNSNIQTNSDKVYSGQLYQLPVPEVTNQIYNRQNSANFVQANNIQQNPQTKPNTNGNTNDRIKTTNDDVEIIQSQTITLPPAAKLQASPTPSELDQFNSQENFNKFINSNNGISAQLQDKIVGVIPHPFENNKLVTYKKDESYYIYTKLDNELSRNLQTRGNVIQSNNIEGQRSAKLVQGNNVPNVVSFQFIPSVSYQLEDEKEQQKILNTFQIDEFGSPRQKNNLIQSSSRPVLTSNVEYSVDHTPAAKQIERLDRQFNDISNLYVGPSSYSAPQGSVGRLRQDNSRLELEDNNGYIKDSPSRQFSF